MADSRASRFRVPHWGWCLLGTVVLAVGYVGVSVWLPWRREQAVIRLIESWGGSVLTETGGPILLQQIAGEARTKEFKVFDRAFDVSLDHSAITDTEIARLRGLTGLRELSVSGTVVTDAGLAQMSECKHLEVIFLRGTAVTDTGLAHLSRLKKLKRLYLDCTVVTGKGIKGLKKAVPDCEIYF